MNSITSVTHKGVYNNIVYLPLALYLAPFRLGADRSTAQNLLVELTQGLQARLAARYGGATLSDWVDPGHIRDDQLALCWLWRLVTDNPTPMRLMRRLAADANVCLFSYGCAAHADNLVAKDLALIEQFKLALRDSIAAGVFFTRSTRAGALLARNAQHLRNAGAKNRSLELYSRTRWVGEAAKITSVLANLLALRRTLADNRHEPPAARISILPRVETIIDSPTTELSLATCVPLLRALASSVAVLEADAAPLSSAVGIFLALRLCLDQSFAELPIAARSSIQSSLGRRFR